MGGDLTEVGALLAEDGRLLEARDDEGLTPLHLACYSAKEAVVRELIERGADVNAVSRSWTPLLMACYARPGDEGQPEDRDPGEIVRALSEIVDILLEHGADARVRSADGKTPLHGAAIWGPDVVAALLDRGASVNATDVDGATPLHEAACTAQLDCLRLLLARGAYPLARNRGGWTPLADAVHKGCQEGADDGLVELFLEAADKEEIHQAAGAGDRQTVLALLSEHQVYATWRDGLGWTPLHWAAWYGKADVTIAILRAEADSCAADLSDLRPLDLAVVRGWSDVIQALLANGADATATGPGGYTALHWAVLYSRTKAIPILLAHGADVDASDSDSVTPLCMAVRNDDRQVVALLLECSADPNSQDSSGQTPLHEAVLNAGPEVVRLLLSHGADPQLADRRGITPAKAAELYGTKEVADLLRKRAGLQ